MQNDWELILAGSQQSLLDEPRSSLFTKQTSKDVRWAESTDVRPRPVSLTERVSGGVWSPGVRASPGLAPYKPTEAKLVLVPKREEENPDMLKGCQLQNGFLQETVT